MRLRIDHPIGVFEFADDAYIHIFRFGADDRLHPFISRLIGRVPRLLRLPARDGEELHRIADRTMQPRPSRARRPLDELARFEPSGAITLGAMARPDMNLEAKGPRFP